MADRRYLLKRGRIWYVQKRVPADLQSIIGMKKITVSLKTEDLKEANARKYATLATIQGLFDRARNSGQLSTLDEAIQIRQEIELGMHGPDKQQLIKDTLISIDVERDRYLMPRSREVLIDPDTGYRMDVDRAKLEEFALAEKVLSGKKVVLLSKALDVHLKEAEGKLRTSTINARRRRVNDFKRWLGGDKEISKISDYIAADYVTEHIMNLDRSVKTKKDTLSDLSAFFNWCYRRRFCRQNPFTGLMATITETTRGTRKKSEGSRRPYKRKELISLFNAIKVNHGTNDPLWLLSIIGLYTGMRGNEIASIQLCDIHDDFIRIPEAKNDASIRDVPIHSFLKPIILKWRKMSTDGFLISGLKGGGQDKKRYHGIGKRFSDIRKKAGLLDDGLKFHSFRHTVITELMNSGVSRETVEQIVGHTSKGMTMRVYNAGLKLPVLLEAINQLEYGEELEELLTG